MDRPRIEQLWQRLVSAGDLSPDEEAELLQALSSDEDLRRDVLEDDDLHRTLAGLARAGRDPEGFVRSFTRRITLDQHGTEFIKKLESRIEEEASRVGGKLSGGSAEAKDTPGLQRRSTRRSLRTSSDGRGQQFLLPVLAAAAVLFGIVLLFSLSSSGPSRPEAGKGEVARREREKAEQARRGAEMRRAEEARAQAEKARKEAEERLAALREQEKKAEDAKRAAGPAQEKNLKEEAEKAFGEIVRKRKEEEERLARLRMQEEASKEAVAKASTEPQPQEKLTTQASVAKVGRVEGEAYLVVKGEKKPAAAGQEIGAGEGVETGEANSFVEISYPDQSRLEMGAGTVVRELKSDGGKRLTLEKGVLRAEMRKQPKDQPMVFATPQGEATVLGTTLKLMVDPDPKKGTRLEVEEGKVELRSKLIGKTVDVVTGQYAVAAVGVEFVTRPLPIDEILLLPSQAKKVGSEWQLVKDEQSSNGSVWEAQDPLSRPSDPQRGAAFFRQVPSHLTFAFRADSDREYSIWIRARCTATQYRYKHDAVDVWVDMDKGAFTTLCPPSGFMDQNVFSIDYFGDFEGYGWRGGVRPPGQKVFKDKDFVNATIRFSRPGLQILKIYIEEGPMRIDAIWLSATQKNCPAADVVGPRSLSGK